MVRDPFEEEGQAFDEEFEKKMKRRKAKEREKRVKENKARREQKWQIRINESKKKSEEEK